VIGFLSMENGLLSRRTSATYGHERRGIELGIGADVLVGVLILGCSSSRSSRPLRQASIQAPRELREGE